MTYLEAFCVPSEKEEASFLLSFPPQLEMQCYDNDNAYPFKIFPQKRLEELTFSPITLLYGGNGSGKSTLLNVIAEKLELERSVPYNKTPLMRDYLAFCDARLSHGRRPPDGSRILTSDGVFDFLLDVRAINEGIDRRREELFSEYEQAKHYLQSHGDSFRMRSLADYDELKRHNEAKQKTKSAYTSRRLPVRELSGKSNGESAFLYFTQKIGENALYLLDEPENSLSATLQKKLADFLEDSVRFFGCQFIISTHSPFLLSMRGAQIYDLDSTPVRERRWSELENVRAYYDLFQKHATDFESK